MARVLRDPRRIRDLHSERVGRARSRPTRRRRGTRRPGRGGACSSRSGMGRRSGSCMTSVTAIARGVAGEATAITDAGRVVERGEPCGAGRRGRTRASPRLERDGLVSIHLDEDPAGRARRRTPRPSCCDDLSRDDRPARTPRTAAAYGARCLVPRSADVHPLARRRDVTALVRPDHDRVATRARRQQVADVDVVEGGELHQPAERDVALVVLDERQERRRRCPWRSETSCNERLPISPLQSRSAASEAAAVFHLYHMVGGLPGGASRAARRPLIGLFERRDDVFGRPPGRRLDRLRRIPPAPSSGSRAAEDPPGSEPRGRCPSGRRLDVGIVAHPRSAERVRVDRFGAGGVVHTSAAPADFSQSTIFAWT